MKKKSLSHIKIENYSVSAIKGLIGAIPCVGTAINEFAFEARSRIKQTRINVFVQTFTEYIQSINGTDFNVEQIEYDDFGDFFENLLVEISRNHSNLKLIAFRNLLANQFIIPQKIDYAELIVRVISKLRETQLLILQGLDKSFYSSYIEKLGDFLTKEKELKILEQKNREKYEEVDNMPYTSTSEIDCLKEKISGLKNEIKKIETPYKAQTYNLEGYEYFFLVQDLCNQALVIDYGMKYNAEPYQLIEITEFGREMMNYIREIKKTE